MTESITDLVIIGAGPSALAASIYTTRENIDTVMVEKSVVGGLAATTDKVDNYPGFPDGIEGYVLAEQLEKQAKKFGAKVEYGLVSSIKDEGEYKLIDVEGKLLKSRTILIATGCDYVKTGAPGEDKYYGRGVHYCATCDGAFYNGKNIAVIGGGNSAVQESIFLTRFTKHIDLLVRSTIKASDVLQKELQKYIDDGKITVHLGTTVSSIDGDDNHANSVQLLTDGKSNKLMVDGVFVFVGLKPNTAFLEGSGVKLDDQGFVLADKELRTNISGIFVSGDVRSGATKQIASAIGEGATAALTIREYLDELNHN